MTEYEQLKPREIEILRLMSDGLTNREIGERLYIGVETVRWYARQIYSKLSVSGRDEAVEKAKSLHLLEETPASEQPKAALKYKLPTQLTSFIGRTNELSELAQLLQKEDVRLVTLAAQGGMGKSRLALECARQHLNTFTDGVYFVELAPLSEFESIVQALIDAVRCPYAPNEQRTRTQQLIEYLSDKHMLLIMDNFEHLIAEAGIVTEILSATSSVRILVTSRQRLNQSNEYIVQLEPMPYPDWETPEDALKYDAFQLFVQSAQRIHANFELTKDNLDSVIRICQVVQGLPLGIVLAASWLSLLSPQEIVEEMRQSFDFLETEMSDIPARLRSIRQVFDYSWQLMTVKERQILMALSVFRGGFTREAAAEVCGAGLRDLMGLMNKSLINRDTTTGRYSIHELLRQYAVEQLKQSGRQETVFDAHKNYFAQWMKAREGEITYRHQQAALDDIEIDFENVRLAWEQAVQQKDYTNLDRMVEALHLFAEMRIRYDDGFKLLQDALDVTPTTERLHYRLVFRLARLAYHGALDDLHVKYYRMLPAAQALAASQEDNVELGLGIYIEAMPLASSINNIKPFERALSLLPPDSPYRRKVLGWRGIAASDYGIKIASFQEALELNREYGDVTELAWTLASLMIALCANLKFSEAEQHFEEALHYSRLIRHPRAESLVLNSIVRFSLYRGEFENALQLVEKSIAQAAQTNFNMAEVWDIALKLQIQYMFNLSVNSTLAEQTRLLLTYMETHPWLARSPLHVMSQVWMHYMNGEDAAARSCWQALSPISPAEWIQIFAVEAILHSRAGEDEFAVVLVGHLATYGDDVVGWLKRWSRYQDALTQLQSRLDEATYKAAFARGQSLTLDQMVQELKTNTGAT